MAKGGRRWLVLAALSSTAFAVTDSTAPVERESRLWVLTSSRLLELDPETGALLHQTPTHHGERLLARGDALPPLIAGKNALRILVPRGGARTIVAPEALRGAEVLAAGQLAESGGVALAVDTGAFTVTPAGSTEQRVSFPGVVAQVATVADDRLWAVGRGGGIHLDLSDRDAAAQAFATSWSAVPTAACYDPLAERLVVAEPEAVHWLDGEGNEVAATPLPGVESLACGAFGRVWAAGSEGVALLRSIGTAGDVERVLPTERAASGEIEVAADPRDFAVFVAATDELSRWTANGERAWRVELGRGEQVRGMVTARRPPAPAPAPATEAAGDSMPSRLQGGPKVLSTELAVRGRLARNETKPTPAPPGSGQPVGAGLVTAYGTGVVSATSAADGTFTTGAMPHTSGDSVLVYSRRQTAAGRLMAATTIAPAAGQTADVGEQWLSWDCGMAFQNGLFPANALNGEVRAAAFFDDGSGPALYVGGTFTTAGGVTVNRVAKWNGATWSALGSGLTITSGTASVDALAVFNDGSGARLYAAGLFNRAGTATVSNVAKWTGTSWVQVGSTTPNGQILALAVYGSQLFAGGAFTKVGTPTVNRLARWSGTAWVAVGTGLNDTVRALASHSDGSTTALYVGGLFTTAGGASAARIAKWNGTAFSALGSGVSGGSTIQVNALSSGQLDGAPALYVGGRFTTAGATTANHVAAWQGNTWKALGGGLGVEVSALASYDDGIGSRLYAAGSFTAVGSTTFNRLGRFTGTKWEPVGSGLNGNALALGAGSVGATSSLFVGGTFTTANGAAASRLARIVRPSTCADTTAPALVWVQPRNGATLTSSQPLLRLGAFDYGASGLDPTSLAILRNGQALGVSCTWSTNGDAVDCTPPPLGGGSVTLVARIRDLNGNLTPDKTLSFTIADSTPPTISFLAPAEGAQLTDPRPRLRFAYSDAGGVNTTTLAVTRGGVALALECQAGANEALCVPAANLPNGATTLAATVRDLQGSLSNTAVRSFSVAAPAPAVTELRGRVVLESGAAASGAVVWLDRIGGYSTVAGADGRFSIANIAVSSAPLLSLSASYSSGVDSYLAFLSAVVPNPGAVTDIGDVVLRRRCDSSFSPLPLVAGGPGIPAINDVNGEIQRLAVFNDGSGPRLYAGGDFNYGDGGGLPRIAAWGSRGWEWSGKGLSSSTQPSVAAFAVFDDGSGPKLYVGGSFTSAGSEAANFLAKWDGTRWQEVGRGVNGRVSGLAVYDDGGGPALFVSGEFSRVRVRKDWAGNDLSTAANQVAKWTGTDWVAVAGVPQYVSHDLRLSLLQGASGSGLYLWEVFGSYLWKLNAGSWQQIAFPAGSSPALTSLASATIGGTTRMFVGGYNFGVREWTGSAWVNTGAALDHTPSIAGHSDASGSYLYESSYAYDWRYGELRRWNGSVWSSVLVAEGGSIETVTGLEAQPILVRRRPFARWQNGAWSPFALTVDTEGPVTSVAIADAPSQALLFAGPTKAGGVTLNGSIGRWNGASVTAVGTGLTGGGSKVVQAFEGLRKHVYGIAESVGQIAEWTGSSWTPVGQALGIPIHDVDWVDVGDGPRLYAGGAGVYRWNGSFWYSIGGPSDIVAQIEGFQGSLYVGLTGYTGASSYHRWNGTQWVAPTIGDAESLKASNGYLFGTSGGKSIWAWNGSTWSNGGGATPPCGVYRNRFIGGLEYPVAGQVHALESFDDGTGPRLIFGGDFAALCQSQSGSTLYATLPGYTNLNLGTGVDGPAVRALAAGRWNGSPAVAVGGDFATAGGQPSGKLAVWHAAPSWGACSTSGRPPKISVSSPVGFTNAATVALVGRVDEPATLRRDGIPVALAADLSFAIAGVALAEGTNTFFLEAVDRTGDRGSLTHQLVRDSVAPTVAFVDPPAGATVFGASGSVDLALTDAASGIDTTSLAVTWNGASLPASACVARETRARCSATVLQGANTATATVRDRAGNTAAPAQLAFQGNTAAGSTTQLVGSVRRANGTAAAGARVHVLGRQGISVATAADGSFSVAVATVAHNAPWTVVAELTEGTTNLVGVKPGVVPIGGGTTSAGVITLRQACESAFSADLFGSTGVAGRVRALAVWDSGSGPALYVGGESLRLANGTWHHLLRWDGERFSTLPSGPNGPVHALALYDDGDGAKLFAGGSFSAAGGVTARGLARWDGTAWSAVGDGVRDCNGNNGKVHALAVLDLGGGPRLYVGGRFNSVGAGTAADMVASWNGGTWSGLGSPPTCNTYVPPSSAVFALASYEAGGGRSLYAGGWFAEIGGVLATNVAKWNGSSWTPLGPGVGRVSYNGNVLPSMVASLAVFGGELYAGGVFNSAGDLTAQVSSIARWNGQRWTVVDQGLESYYVESDFGVDARPTGVQALAVFDDGSGPALYATGSFTGASLTSFTSIARWNGQRWSPVGRGLGDPSTGGMALAPFGGELYAGGGFASAGGHGAAGIARWSGQVWRPLGRGFDGAVRALAVHDDGTGAALYAGGAFTSFGDVTLNHVGRFDGTAWVPMGAGTEGEVTTLESFDDGSGTALYAGGAFTLAGGVAASHVARWRNGSWEALGSGLDAGAIVNAFVGHDDGAGRALYVGGQIVQAGGASVSNLARWRQGSWSPAGSFSGPVRALLSAVVGGSSRLFAGGDFTAVDGIAAPYLARWNGSSWSALGSGPGDRVAALASWQGGGLAAGRDGAGSVAIWDGAQWSVSGWPLNSPIAALERWNDGFGDALFAAGTFRNGWTTIDGVARGPAVTWTVLGGGMSDGSVRALQPFEDASGAALFVGGSFTAAGGVPSYALAKWTRPLTCTDTQPPTIAITMPAAGFVKGKPQLSVSYADADSGVEPASLQWTLDGVAITATCTPVTGGAGCGPDVAFAEGPHELGASVADLAGNRGTAVPVAITADTLPPAVAFTAPLDGSVVIDTSPGLAFTWADGGSGIELGGFDLFQSGTSSWRLACTYNAPGGSCSQQLPLGDGRWSVRASIVDRAGNLGEAHATFTVETQPPALEVIAPVEGGYTHDTTPDIVLRLSDAGTGVDPASLALTAGGAALAVSCNAGGEVTTCVPVTPLPAGAVQLGVTVRDRHGRQATASRSFTVTLDFTAPTIDVTSPADGLLTAAAEVLVTGSLSEPADVTLGAASITVQPDLSFGHGPVPLVEGANSFTLVAVDGSGNRRERTLLVRRDATPPTLDITNISEGGLYDLGERPVEIGWSDDLAGIDETSLVLELNGVAQATSCTSLPSGTSCSLAQAPSGALTLAVTVRDLAGNVSAPAVVHFTSTAGQDLVPPAIELLSPRPNSAVRIAAQRLIGRVSEAATLTLDGEPLALAGDWTFAKDLVLSEGANNLHLCAVDGAGNIGTLDFTLTLDSAMPAAPVDALIGIAESSPALFLVHGAAGAALDAVTSSVVVRNRRGETIWAFPVAADGSFAGEIVGLPGDSVEISVRDAAGNEGTSITRLLAGTMPSPPDPTAVAPPSDPSTPTDLCASTRFLWTGTTKVQFGAHAEAFDCAHLVVVRGRVTDRGGAPLAAVRVAVDGHPELGLTLTRADGAYDLATGGGGTVTLTFHKDGYFPVRRTQVLPWRDWATYPDVVLTAPDAAVTPVDTSSSTPIQVVRGSAVSDGDGARQATLLFPQGLHAQALLPNGQSLPLETLHVRATEYSLGNRGPASLPAELPPTMAYTYAVELGVDEASAVGAESVEFDRQVPFYLDGFIAFPVGVELPAAYLDRATGQWVGAENGRVVAVLAENGGRAVLDVTGGGQAATAESLAALGITDAELDIVAQLYEPGQRLWRVPIRHFTPWSITLPFRSIDPPGPDGRLPTAGDSKDLDKPTVTSFAGTIEVENQILAQALPLAGTGLSLHYSSDRVPGRKAPYVLTIPLTSATVDPRVRGVDVTVDVAGRRFLNSFPATASLSFDFPWNGLDRFDRPVSGPTPWTVKVSYLVEGVYAQPSTSNPAFGYMGGISYENLPTRNLSVVSQETTGALGALQATSTLGLGGWSLPMHHVLDIEQSTLFYGDGRRRHLGDDSEQPDVLTRVAGTGARGSTGDGGHAKDAHLDGPVGVSLMRDGSLLVTEAGSCRVRKIDPSDVITTVVGSTCAAWGQQVIDGEPALLARLNTPKKAIEGPDGGIYVSEVNRVRRVDPSTGTIHTVAGSGTFGCAGIPGAARQAELTTILDMAFDAQGNLLLSTSPCPAQQGSTSGILQVDPRGRISVVVPTVEPECMGPTCPQRIFPGATGLAPAPDGSMYFTQSSRVARRPPEGRQSETRDWTIAGKIANFQVAEPPLAGDGEPAGPDNTRFLRPSGIARGADGTLYVADSGNGRVRAIGPDKVVNTIAGGGLQFAAVDEMPATKAALVGPVGLALDPGQRSVYFSEPRTNKVWRVGVPAIRASQGAAGSEHTVPSEDGSQLFVFDGSGRHLRTEDSVTRKVLWTFRYTSYPLPSFGSGETQLLTEAEDAFGNVIRIERDAEHGAPRAIVAPFGQRSELLLDEHGHLRELNRRVGADTERVTLATSAQGLLESITTPKGQPYHYTYDNDGRLTRVDDPEQGQLSLTFDEHLHGYTVTATTAEGSTSSTEVERLPTREIHQRVTLPNGEIVESLRKRDGTIEETYPDKSKVTVETGAEPRLGAKSPMMTSTRFASEDRRYERSVEHARLVSGDASDPLSLATQTDTWSENGRTTTSNYLAATRTLQVTSPEGRHREVVFDAFGRASKMQSPGLVDVEISYDAKGRVSEVRQGTGNDERKRSYSYDEKGFLETVTDPLLDVTRYERDDVGRVKKAILPDLREVRYEYDLNGNLTKVTPPSRPAHAFAYDDVDQPSSYAPPAVHTADPSTLYTYDRDRKLTLVTRPDGEQVAFAYDDAGRPTGVTSALATTSYTYDEDGKLATVAGSAGESVAYTYDGPWLKEVRLEGPVAATVQLEADRPQPGSSQTNFWLSSLRINDRAETEIALEHEDDDGLPTKIGDWQPFYQPASGRLLGSHVLQTGDRLTRDSFGELARLEAGYFGGGAGSGGQPPFTGSALLDVTYQRDKLGRIVRKSEQTRTAPGSPPSSHVFKYTYEERSGRLTQARRDGTVVETYAYDENGNRKSWTTGFGSGTATYDAQDRLVTYGPLSFTYTANGELRSESQGSQTTTYTYDAFSNLRGVRLPDGVQIEYLVDGANHRIGKKVNGTLVQRWLYVGGASPLAELDEAGNVTKQYVYGANGNVPEYFTRGGAKYRMFTDHVGSVRFVLDAATGTVAQRMDYDSFGRVTLDTNPGFQPFGFAGGLYDYQTGLVRFGARDYDAETGRWTTKDPIGFAGGDTNLYGYTLGDPVNLTDPAGTETSVCATLGDGDCEPTDEEAIGLANFTAGAGDSLTMGVTGIVRAATTGDGIVNRCSSEYRAGEKVEVAAEVVLTLGSAVLKKAAANASRTAVRNEARRLTRNIARNGMELDHINPLFGHPLPLGGGPTLFPTGGLPAAVHSGGWNLRLLGPQAHLAAHARLMFLETVAKVVVNPLTTALRVVRNGTNDSQCSE